MVTDILMPRLSLTMTEGMVLKWFKGEGEQVEKGEPIVLVFGEKTEYEVEAPTSGVLLKKLVTKDEEVPVKAILGFIGEPGEEIPPIVAKAVELPKKEERKLKSEELESKEVVTIPSILEKSRISASPVAKRLAKEHGINLTRVQATGPRGRITRQDVERFLTQREMVKKIKQTEAMSPMRRTIAKRMTHSAQTAPHIWIQMEVDMSDVVALRETLLQQTDPYVEPRVSYTDILIKAVSDAIKAHLLINSTLEGDQIQIFEDINIGLAVQAEQGLIVPVIRQTGRKSITEIALARKQLLGKIKEGTLPAEMLSGGTFTITNLGPFGVDSFFPVINPPETGILAVGRITEKQVVIGSKIEIRPMMGLTLAVDHRVIDGAPAAQFLSDIKKNLENPYMLKI
ncbi:MAG: dihydrolipoamide acetyltransferase family protein [Candidatus Heimdallarchaeota archaeon]